MLDQGKWIENREFLQNRVPLSLRPEARKNQLQKFHCPAEFVLLPVSDCRRLMCGFRVAVNAARKQKPGYAGTGVYQGRRRCI